MPGRATEAVRGIYGEMGFFASPRRLLPGLSFFLRELENTNFEGGAGRGRQEREGTRARATKKGVASHSSFQQFKNLFNALSAGFNRSHDLLFIFRSLFLGGSGDGGLFPFDQFLKLCLLRF